MVASGDAAGALAELDTAVTEGVDVGEMLEQLLGLLRDAMTALAGCGGDVMLFAASTAEQQAVAKVGESLGLERILAMLQIVEETLARLRYSTHRRTLAEVALVRLSRLEDLEMIATLAAQLAQGGDVPTAGAPRPAPRMSASPAAHSADSAAKKKPPAEAVMARLPGTSGAPPQPVSAVESSPPPPNPRVPGASVGPAVVSDTPPQTVPTVDVSSVPTASIAAPHGAPHAADQQAESESFDYDEPSYDSTLVEEPSQYGVPHSTSNHSPSASVAFASDEAAEKAWNACLEKLSGMVAARGKNYQKVGVRGQRLEVAFSQTYNFCKSFFEQHERRRVVEQTLSEIVGAAVHVNFVIAQGDAAAAPAVEAPRQVSPVQRLKAVHEHAMVRRMTDLFGSKIDIIE